MSRYLRSILVCVSLLLCHTPILSSNSISNDASVTIAYPILGSRIVDSSISVTGANLSGAYVIIRDGYSPAHDTILATMSGGITQSWNNTTGVLTLSGSGTFSTYTAILRSAYFYTTAATPTSRTITFVLGNLYPYFDANTMNKDTNYASPGDVPHFYIQDGTARRAREAMNLSASAVTKPNFGTINNVPYDSSLNGSTTYSYLGLKGYLATVTSLTERETLDAVRDSASTWLGGSDSVTEQSWTWHVGPEAGTTFWEGRSGGSVQNELYANWNGNQPDDSSGQDFLRVPNDWGGYWDDRDDDLNHYNIIEYGGLSGDPRVLVNKTVKVENRPVIALSATSKTYESGNLTVDSGLTVSGGQVIGGTVTLVNAQSGDSLSVTAANGISGSYNSSTGVLTLTGFDKTAAQYQAVLRTLVYSNSTNTAGTAGRLLRYALTDTGLTQEMRIIPARSEISKDGVTTKTVYFGVASSYVVDDSITVTGPNLSGAYVKITSGFVSGQDVLSATNVGSLSGSYNSSTGLLTITGTGTAAEYQTLLRSVRYANSSGSPTYGTREIKFVLGSILPNFSNNHFYKIITGNAPTPVWSDAKSRASENSYLGHQGYLATVTSSTEMDHIISLGIPSYLWLGGSDAASEGTWRWVTGPEGLENSGAGRLFWNGAGITNGGSAQLPDNYANWNGNTEPNNSGSAEHYLQLFTNGTWNDLPVTSVYDYLVEYGGMPGDPVTTVVKNVVLLEGVNLDLSITNNIFITSVGLTTPGESIFVDSGVAVSGGPIIYGIVRLWNFQTGDILSVTDQNGITSSYDSGNGVLTLSGSASSAAYQAILRTLKYENTQNSPDMTTRSVGYTLFYGVNGEHLYKNMMIQMQRPSKLTGTVSSQIYFTGEDEWMTLDAGIGLSGGDLTDFRVYVPSGANVTYTDTVLSESYGSGTLALSGSGTSGTYQTAIRSVAIKPNSVGSNFTVSMAVGHLSSPTQTEMFSYSTIGSDATSAASMAGSKSYYGWRGSVYSANTGAKTVVVQYTTPSGTYGGPTVLTHGVSFTKYTAPGIAANLTSNVVIVKPNLDSPPESIVLDGMIGLTGGASQESPLRGARVKLTTNFQSLQDSLTATASNGLSVSYASGTGILTISGTGTVGSYESVFRTVRYTNSVNSPNVATRTVQFEIDYGGTNLTTKTVSSTMNVRFETPNVMGKGAVTTMNYYVQSSAVTVDASITVTGPDLSGAYVKITSGLDPNDELSAAPVSGVSGSYNSSTGLLTITGSGSAATYQAFLRGVKYRNTSGSPSYVDRKIEFVLGTVLPEFSSGHFYVYAGTAATWDQAKVRAAATSYLGYRGYLATIRSAVENTHVGTLGYSGAPFLGADGQPGVNFNDWVWQTEPAGSVLFYKSVGGAQNGEYNNFDVNTFGGTYKTGQYYVVRPAVGNWSALGNVSNAYVVEYKGYSGEHGVQVSKTVEVRDRHVVQLTTTLNTYVKNSGTLLLDDQLVVAGYTISSASVQIGTGLDVSVDSLTATASNGITVGYVTANGTLSLTGSGTSKSYQDIFRTVRYRNSAVTPVEGTRNVVFEVRFGDDPYFTTSASMNVFVSPVYTMSASVVTVNFFSGRGPLPVPTGLSVSGGTLSAAMAKIVTNYLSTQDRLVATDNYGITSSFDIPSGVLMLSGVATAAQYEEVLGSISYTNIVVSPTPLTKQVQIVLGSKLPTTYNNHFYEGNAYPTPPSIPQEWGPTTRQQTYTAYSELSWEEARLLASTRAYLGWKGYLATVTSAAENATVAGLISGETWLAGTDRASQNTWRWVTGPEGLENSGAGRVFSFTNWSGGQPNNGLSGEDYLHLVYTIGGTPFYWTDLQVRGIAPIYPKQFVSEYGGFSGEETFWVTIPVKVFGSNHTIFFGTMF